MSVSCVIPAYNEAPRIGGVLKAALGCQDIDEVIVVDDGSRDDTKTVVSRLPGAIYLRHQKNLGKSMAIHTGLCRAKGELILLLDADLVNLTPENLGRLLKPVLSSPEAVSIAILGNSLRIFKILGIDVLSGQRAFHRKLLRDEMKGFEKLDYGFEVAMNACIARKEITAAVVNWSNVLHVLKCQKMNPLVGLLKELRMMAIFLRTTGLSRFLYQCYFLAKNKKTLL